MIELIGYHRTTKINAEKMCLVCYLYKNYHKIDVMAFTFSKKSSSDIKDIIGFKTLPERQICISNYQCINYIQVIVRGENYVKKE